MATSMSELRTTVKSRVRRVVPGRIWTVAGQTRDWTQVVPLYDAPRVRQLLARRGSPRHAGRLHRIYVRPLHRRVGLREGTTDAAVLKDTFVGLYHLPPAEIPDPTTVLDLGSNIGLTVAHYAVLYPHARILGIELDPEAAELARRNTAAFGDRCLVVSGAAWVRTEEVWFQRVVGEEYGAHVADPTEGSIPVQGHSIGSLIDRLGGSVDFLKMDIEGGELEVLESNTDWAEAVRAIKLEVHGGPAAIETCGNRLHALGYDVSPDERHPAGLVALRPAEPVPDLRADVTRGRDR